MFPRHRPPSLRRPPAWPLLHSSPSNDESAPPFGWQRNPRLINRSGNHRLHVWMRQLAGRVHPDEAGLLSRSQQKLLRVGQLRSLIEVQSHTGGTSGERHDAIDPGVRRRIADDDGIVVVVRQLVGGRESLTYSSPDRSNERLILRIKPVDEGPELGLRRKFPAIGFHCHRILPVVLSSSVSRYSGRPSCQPSLSSRTAGPEFDKSSKNKFRPGSPYLYRQQDLNSSSYYGERSCDELGYKQRKLDFAIEPGKTPKIATKQRCEKNSQGAGI